MTIFGPTCYDYRDPNERVVAQFNYLSRVRHDAIKPIPVKGPNMVSKEKPEMKPEPGIPWSSAAADELVKTPPLSDLVNHPSHYNVGKIEVIEAIEDWKLNYHRGQVIKYVARAGHKSAEHEVQDLEKALWYLTREIECHNALKEGRAPLRPNDMPIVRAKK